MKKRIKKSIEMKRGGKSNTGSSKFWTEDGDNVTIKNVKLVSFLEENGFYKYITSPTKYDLVQLKNNIISPVGDHVIPAIIRRYLERNNKLNVLEKYMRSGSRNKILLDTLNTFDHKLSRDSKEKIYFYFQNKIISVTTDGYKEIDYCDHKAAVWNGSIMKKNIKPSTDESVFETFILNVAGNDKKRKASLESIIGYLLSDYKDSANAKAIIFQDQNIDFYGSANGGTGKTLVGKAINFLRPTIQISGKSLNTQARFLFQQVEKQTRVLFYDDVRPDFNFEDLYAVITGDMTAEKKHQAAITIPFSESPKILISSNHIVKGTGGDSDRRRIVEFEFSNHYNLKNTPPSEFKHRFFDEWNEKDWNNFFSYMFYCALQYLKNGIILPESINLDQNRLTSHTCPEFIEYMDTIDLKERHDKGELFDEFEEIYSISNQSDLSKHKFKKWIDHFADHHKMESHHTKSNGGAFVSFTHKN